VDQVLRSETLRATLAEYRRDVVTRLVRSTLQDYRDARPYVGASPSAGELADIVRSRISNDWAVGPRRVINATGVVLHTNLARAPLSSAARDAIEEAAGYCDLEFELHDGDRGNRQARIGRQLTALTGAEAAFVTVSASSAVLLMLTALAKRREVIVSRGQSLEIGGGFRVPVVLKQSGAKLIEVGTTNRTRLEDYAEAITSRTAAILNVHASNFRIVGFTESVELSELSELARARGIPLVDDNGSGALLGTERFGLAHEPMVQESLAAGVDLVAFSGDKLVGGPQAGLILGRAALVNRLRSHPLARAVRPDKVTLAALSATVYAYLAGNAEETVPVWRMISQSSQQIEVRARRLQSQAQAKGLQLQLAPGESTVGGGSLPGEMLPTTLLILPPSIQSESLRGLELPIVGRIHAGRTVVDLRTVSEEEESLLLAGLLAAQRVTRQSPG
jgi:L-seryl-tRNA(Ser) seleniumtransferase